MNKKLISGKLLRLTIISALILSFGIISFADSSEHQKLDNVPMKICKDDHVRHVKLNVVLNMLVSEGKITQTRADEIIKLVDKKIDEIKNDYGSHNNSDYKPVRKNIIWELYSSGDITKEEATAIKFKLHELRKEDFNNKLNILQQKGILSSSDIEKINSFMSSEREEKRKTMEKLKTMTEEERKQYFEVNKHNHKPMLQKMIDGKVITEKQAEEIKKIMPEFGNRKNRGN